MGKLGGQKENSRELSGANASMASRLAAEKPMLVNNNSSRDTGKKTLKSGTLYSIG
jgi:uncharacterized membrane protein YebE (DUF533 family)